jgi:hypothetical protein
LVTCDVATTLAASQIPGLSVFPCLSPLHQENDAHNYQGNALSSVLQIAAGISCPLSILVVDITALHDLPKINRKPVKNYQLIKNSPLNLKNQPGNRGYEWFQALIQYLQTAGFRASIASCWSEVLQQVSHKSVDLLLICLQETPMHQEVHKAIQSLGDLSFTLPPILVLDQKLNQPNYENSTKSRKQRYTSSIETAVSEIATQILPRSISMEELLTQINQALSNYNRLWVNQAQHK